MIRLGIVGFGSVGKYLYDEITTNGSKLGFEISFVWNRSVEALASLPKELILNDLDEFSKYDVDLIVEVAHPSISKEYGAKFLCKANYFVGSPTAFADQETEDNLRKAAQNEKRSVFVPNGAFWGATDIQKMADRGTLKGLKVTMKKHPSSFRLNGEIELINATLLEKGSGSVTLYEGPVRALCPLAPNNVNTMAAAAIAAHNIGFDNVIGCLVSDCSLHDRHIVEVNVTGPLSPTGGQFSVTTTRINPASTKAVTGQATYASFLSSLIRAQNQPPGVHLC